MKQLEIKRFFKNHKKEKVNENKKMTSLHFAAEAGSMKITQWLMGIAIVLGATGQVVSWVI